MNIWRMLYRMMRQIHPAIPSPPRRHLSDDALECRVVGGSPSGMPDRVLIPSAQGPGGIELSREETMKHLQSAMDQIYALYCDVERNGPGQFGQVVWPKELGSFRNASTAVCDVKGDGTLTIIVGSRDYQVSICPL